jgi:membrane protein
VSLPSNDLAALIQRVWGSFAGRCVDRFVTMAGIDRSIVLASQAFTALIPLLMLVSALAPPGQEDVVARTLIAKFGLTGDSASAVEQLFEIPGDATSSLSIASVVLLVFSGVSFTRRLQRMYRGAWGQEKAGVRGGLFAALGLFALLAEMVVVYGVQTLVGNLPFDWLLAPPLAAVSGFALWTSIPYLLLNRQVHWRRLVLAGAVSSTAIAIYSIGTAVYLPAHAERYVQNFGLFGITIAIIGWLLGIAMVLVASTAIGAEFDSCRAPWAVGLKARYGLADPEMEGALSVVEAQDSGLNREDLLLLARVLVNWLVMVAAVWAATAIVPGIEVTGGLPTYLLVSLLFGLVNAVLGPLLYLIALPLTVLTLGLSALVVNGLLLAITAGLSSKLDVGGFGGTVLGALVISVVITLLELVLRPLRHER